MYKRLKNWVHKFCVSYRIFEGKLNFLKKFPFQNSHLNDSEKIQLCKILIEHKNSYATHRDGVRTISTPIPIRLKPDAKLQTQRPT